MGTKIYGLYHPLTGRVRYVGKCVTALGVRLKGHEYKARSGRAKSPIGDWIRALQKRGLRPSIRLLEEVAGRWQDAERNWIARLRSEGHRLLNLHPGGNGAHTRSALDPKLVPLLGKISDARIAAMTNLCRETITYHRHRAGIPASFDHTLNIGKGTGRDRLPLPEEVLNLVGKVTDKELAEKCGVSKQTIAHRRKVLGLPAVPKEVRRLRYRRGSLHPNTKLSENDVKYIRSEVSDGVSPYAIAKVLKVNASTVYAVVRGETHKEEIG